MSIMLRCVTLIAVFTLAASCAFSKKLPEWIEQEPYDPLYYSTVVKVSVKQPDYRQYAMDVAFKNISMQISVSVDAQLSSSDIELSGIPISEFSSNIQTSSRNQLQDVELVAVHETKKDYWAYFRLNKRQYQAKRMELKDQALTLAVQQLTEFDSAKADVVARLPLLTHALELLIDYLDLDLDVSYRGREINLYSEILLRLKQLPLKLKPVFKDGQLTVTAQQNLNLSIPVSVEYSVDNNSYRCSGFPLKASFQKGKGKLGGSGYTADSGWMDLFLDRVTSTESDQTIRIDLDTNYFSNQISHPLVKKIFSSLAFPSALLKLQVLKPKVHIVYSFNSQPGAYKKLITDRLVELGLEVVEQVEAADYVLEVAIKSRQGDYIKAFDVYSAFGDGSVNLIQNPSGETVASESLLSVKSNGKTMPLAEKSTELNTVRELCNELLYRMVSSHITQ